MAALPCEDLQRGRRNTRQRCFWHHCRPNRSTHASLTSHASIAFPAQIHAISLQFRPAPPSQEYRICICYSGPSLLPQTTSLVASTSRFAFPDPNRNFHFFHIHSFGLLASACIRLPRQELAIYLPSASSFTNGHIRFVSPLPEGFLALPEPLLCFPLKQKQPITYQRQLSFPLHLS